jgi:hypothetical protein
VLNTRDPDEWLVSMEKTFYVIIGWKSIDYLGPFDMVRISISPQPFPTIMNYFCALPIPKRTVLMACVVEGRDWRRLVDAECRAGYLDPE